MSRFPHGGTGVGGSAVTGSALTHWQGDPVPRPRSPDQLVLPLILDRFELREGSGRAFVQWLDSWKQAGGVRVLVAEDFSDVIVIPEGSRLWLEKGDRFDTR